MPGALDSTGKRVLGLATGVAFGALLQRGRLARYDVILGQLRLRDGSVVKAMSSAVAVGAVGLHLLQRNGLTGTEVKPMKTGGVVAGAVLFGVGMATLGYCPGTAVAAVGEGNRDALLGVAGMLAGAAVFVALYPKIAAVIDAGRDFGKATLPAVTTTNRTPWVTAVAVTTLAGALANEALHRAAR